MQIESPDLANLPSKRWLKIATFIAVITTALLAVVVVLPAERGIDLTGLGAKLKLTGMGQLKVALAEEDAPLEDRPSQQDELKVVLIPGWGKEVKMDMKKGYKAQYQWQATAVVYHDTHGDIYADPDVYTSYSIEDQVVEDSGEIIAPYGGHHGWYWENRGSGIVTLTLKTSGEYQSIEVK